MVRKIEIVKFLDPTNGCWKFAYGRGVGVPISTCPPGKELDAGLCYNPCDPGLKGVGPVCYPSCPPDFTDIGFFCQKPASYWVGDQNYALWDSGKCNNDHQDVGGCEQWGAFYYPKCKANFHKVACCVCSPDCPNGMPDTGTGCQKNTQARGVGTPMVCTQDQDYDAGLCYTKCKSGYSGVGPLCWLDCRPTMFTCGAYCAPSADACTDFVQKVSEHLIIGLIEAIASAVFEVWGLVVNAIVTTIINLSKDLSRPVCIVVPPN